jgi:hypothetical protein
MSPHAAAGYAASGQWQAISKAGKRIVRPTRPSQRVGWRSNDEPLAFACLSGVRLAVPPQSSPFTRQGPGDGDTSLRTQTWFPRVFGLSVAAGQGRAAAAASTSREIATDRVRFGNGGEHCRRPGPGAESSFVPCRRQTGDRTGREGTSPHMTWSLSLLASGATRLTRISHSVPFQSAKGKRPKTQSNHRRRVCTACAFPIDLLVLISGCK